MTPMEQVLSFLNRWQQTCEDLEHITQSKKPTS